MMSIGPFPLAYAVLGLSLLIGAGVGRYLAKGLGIGSLLLDLLWVGVLGARLVFIALWFDLYPSLWAMIDIRDGGYNVWGGLVAALLYAAWRVRLNIPLRQPLAWSLLAGALAWGAMTAIVSMQKPAQLSALPLQPLAGTNTTLAKLADGKPLVLNLWASWCPPCLREMPVLQAAQVVEPHIRFVFANQGEANAVVEQYLHKNKLNLSHVLVDPFSLLAKEYGAVAFPSTLFFSADGQLLDTHRGELSAASLASKLKLLRSAQSE
ncbi:TlpA family protein disulfide reductase [Iodobacter sp.]|uniref:TlpA family protein disulfide reductase n=1 Tax=Iodobacter sp. TaxID=1915058 RepID=UPI0025F2E6C1|nr:TlpA family protein disulfide reductase [Iodobacter sp.]